MLAVLSDHGETVQQFEPLGFFLAMRFAGHRLGRKFDRAGSSIRRETVWATATPIRSEYPNG